MQLTVRDVAKLFNVTEKTIYRWIKQGTIPFYRVSDQYRFNRAELLEWAIARKIEVSAEIVHEPEHHSTPLPTLVEALETGGIFYRVEGSDIESVLAGMVKTIHIPPEVDREMLLRVLLAREAMASTAVGDGIAIPHVRSPIILHIPRPLIALCFLEKAIPYHALDGKPVHTLFLLISPTIRAHLHLLSRLAFVLRHPAFKEAVLQQGSRTAILEELRQVEVSLPQPVDQPLRNSVGES